MSVRLAETAFRWLMRAYPARFRRAHGLALFELFRDEAREAHAQRGAIGPWLLVGRAALDIVLNGPRAWLTAGPSPPRTWSLAGVSHDVHVAARQLRKSPGFTAVAVITLAVAIGVNTTIFSLMNAILLRPLAARDSDRVVRVTARATAGGASARRFSGPELRDYRERSRTLEELSAVNLATFALEADGRTDQVLGEVASGGYLSLLGANITQGRLLGGSDDVPGAPPVAVISDALWRRRFGGDPVVGRPIVLNRTPYTIVGVADAQTIGSFVAVPVDVWVPVETSGLVLGVNWRTDRTQRDLMMLGRLRRGVLLSQAQAEIQGIARDLAREYGDGAPARVGGSARTRVELEPATLATGDQRRLARMFLSLLLGLVALVLLIACANIANLLLARILGRRRELAVRLALGASRARLARMLIAEGLLLSAAGGAGALLLSAWTSRVFANFRVLPTLALRLDLRPDIRVIEFTVLLAVLSAIGLGLIGVFQVIGPDIAPALTENSNGSIGGPTTRRIRPALAAIQVTVSLLLLIGAALFARSAREAAATTLGFDPNGVIALDIGAFGGRTSEQSRRLFDEVLRRAATMPGVEAAAVSTRAPLDSSTPLVGVSPREAVGPSRDPASPLVSFLIVSENYFEVVRTPIVAGRSFAASDDASRPAVAIVNETLARRFWPHEDPIGRRLWLDAVATYKPATPCLVVGVAKDSRYVTIGESQQGHVYLPVAQQPRRGMTLLVRSRAPSDRTIQDTQSLLTSIDPHLQGFFARTLTDHVGVSLLPVRVAASLTTIVAALALGLAVIGLYSLVSFLVAERRSEIGLRIALGADRSDILRMVVGYGVKLALAGLVVGVPIAFVSTRLLRSLLYGVSPTDPFVFVTVSLAVVLVAAIACSMPAARAMRLDPMQALRRS